MNFLKRFFYPEQDLRVSLGLLLIRLVMGAAFMQHGLGKIRNPFHWMDAMGNPMPGFLQMLAALAEFGGGIALFFGVLFPVFVGLILCTMVVATQVVASAGGVFVSNTPPNPPSFELSVVYLALTLLFLCTGPGQYSADYFLLHRKRKPVPA